MSETMIERISTPADIAEEMARDVREGLTQPQKSLPPKYFYDERGSELFEEITRLDEYYLTRAETEILEDQARALIDRVRPEEIVELGSGSSRKTRLLLEAMHDAGTGDRYTPLDVSEGALRSACSDLIADYDWLVFDGILGDFHTDLPRVPRHGRRLVAFLGSTIGNFDPEGRTVLLKDVATMLEGGDRFLLGADLDKDPDVLVAAYDDARGVTAEFNRNMLRVVNNVLGSDFDPARFAHEARYEGRWPRIEMHLRATEPMRVTFPTLDLAVSFEEGETLHTEISSKFTREMIEAELEAAGLVMEAFLMDTQGRFSLTLAGKA